MTDLEMTQWCADAMGLDIRGTASMVFGSGVVDDTALIAVESGGGFTFDPLHDDAQAMALVKRLNLWITPSWTVESDGFVTNKENLNSAIVECVAKMQKAKVAA